jgi:hypothetical protein
MKSLASPDTSRSRRARRRDFLRLAPLRKFQNLKSAKKHPNSWGIPQILEDLFFWNGLNHGVHIYRLGPAFDPDRAEVLKRQVITWLERLGGWPID